MSYPSSPANALGRALALAGMRYFQQYDTNIDLAAGLTHAYVNSSDTAYCFVSGLRTYRFLKDIGLQMPFIPDDANVDIHGDPDQAYDLDGTAVARKDLALPAVDRLLSIDASNLENAILEEVFNSSSISTTKGIQLAKTKGIRVWILSADANNYGAFQTATNNSAHPIPTNVLADVQSRISAGSIITIPQERITLGTWTGTVYFEQDPNSGYLSSWINSSLGGGNLAADPLPAPANVPQSSFPNETIAGDPVNVANGNMTRSEIDVHIPNVGIPLEFARHYNSQNAVDRGLGVGWTHSYSDRLAFPGAGRVVWVTAEGMANWFVPNGAGGYKAPPGVFETLQWDGARYFLTSKDGLTRVFNKDGYLLNISDRYKNALALGYDMATGRLKSVFSWKGVGVQPDRWLTFEYNAAGDIFKMRDSTGRVWRYDYTQLTDPGTSTVRQYLTQVQVYSQADDPQPIITSVHVVPKLPGRGGSSTDYYVQVTTYPAPANPAASVSYGYYAGGLVNGLMRWITEPDGGTHYFSYYPNRKVFEAADALGKTTQLSYDLFRDRTTFTDERGNATLYDYNNDGLLRRLVHPDHAAESFEWLNGSMASWTDTLGLKESYLLNADGDLLSTTDRLGKTTTMTYGAYHQLTSVTRPGGRVTNYTVDSAGSTVAIVEAVDGVTTDRTTQAFDPRGQLVSRTLPRGNLTSTPDDAFTTRYTYNDAGLVSTVKKGPLGSPVATESFSYDARGDLLTSTDASGILTTYTYDLLGRRLTQTLPDPDGTGPLGPLTTSWRYDKAGDVVARTDPRGLTTRYGYDLKQRLVRTDHADGTSAGAAYDPAGNLASAADELGRTTRYVYDQRNRLVQTAYADHSVVRAQYDGDDRVTATIDARGNATSYTYDKLGRVLRETQPDPDGDGPLTAAPVVYTYDPLTERLAGVQDLRGGVTSYTYDLLDRVTKVLGPEKAVVTIDYDADGNVTDSVRYDVTDLSPAAIPADPRAQLPEWRKRHQQASYDALDRPTTGTDALGHTSSAFYDLAGKLLSTTDERGGVTAYHYDAAGRLDKVTAPDPDGPGGPLASPVTNFTLDADGNVVRVSDPLSHPTDYAYDLRNRNTTVTDALGGKEQMVYDPAGQVVAQADALGRTTQYAFDALGRVVRMTDPDPDGGGPLAAPVTRYQYDAAGNLLKVSDPLKRETSYSYDALNRLLQETLPDPDGAGALPAPATLYGYDAAGDLLKVTDLSYPDPANHATAYTYDTAGRRTSETLPDPDGAGPLAAAYTDYAYDDLGGLLTVSDASGHTTTAYDHLGRVKTVTQALSATAGATTSYSYDAAGNLLSVTDPDGNRTDYSYDDLNRPTQETIYLPAGGGTASASRSRSYDAVGNVLTATDRNGRTRRFTYDGLDRQTREEWLDANGNAVETIAATYDAAGQLQGLSESSTVTLSYLYDGLGRQTSVTSAPSTTAFAAPTVTFTDAYGASGDMLSRAETINGVAGATTSYSYDGLHRVTSEQQAGGVAAKRVDFAYNELGQMTQASRYADTSGTALVASTAYGYDGANRLTSVSHTKGATTLASYTVAYDAANRVTSKTSAAEGAAAFQYDSAGQLTQSSGPGPAQSYGYDAAGNRSGTGYVTGPYNRLLSDGTYTYEYDAEGNRTKRTSLATGATDEYSWDYRDRLTRVLSKTSGGAVTKDVRYAYDPEDDRVRKQVDANGDGTYEATENYAYAGGQLALVLDGAGAVQERYLYGPGVDQPLAVERGGSVKWLLADDQGTVRDVLDASGAVVDHLAVDAFGVVVSQTNASAQPRFVYTGRELDLESGLYQYRARYYDAAAGRFLSEDPSGFAAGDANLYRYAGNSAPNLTDPSGLRPQTPLESWLAPDTSLADRGADWSMPRGGEGAGDWAARVFDASWEKSAYRPPDQEYYQARQAFIDAAERGALDGAWHPDGGTVKFYGGVPFFGAEDDFAAYAQSALAYAVGQAIASGTYGEEMRILGTWGAVGQDPLYDIAGQEALRRLDFFDTGKFERFAWHVSLELVSKAPPALVFRLGFEAASGYDVATGERLSSGQRWLRVGVLAAPVAAVGAGKVIGKALARAEAGAAKAAAAAPRTVPNEINFGRAGRVVPNEINFGRAGRVVPNEVVIRRASAQHIAETRAAFDAPGGVRAQFWQHEAATNPGAWRPEDLTMMRRGNAPFGTDGRPMILHHQLPIEWGGTNDFSNLRMMRWSDHALRPNFGLLHTPPFDIIWDWR